MELMSRENGRHKERNKETYNRNPIPTPPENLRSLVGRFVHGIRVAIGNTQGRGRIWKESSVFGYNVVGTALIPYVIAFQVGFYPVICEISGREGCGGLRNAVVC